MIFNYLQSLNNKTIHQFISYAFIGLVSNFLGFGCYYVLTYLFSSPKLTMTLLYSIGSIVSFFANRRFTFKHSGQIGVSGIRFVLVQFLGYLLNLSLLLLFVDYLGYKHQMVQAIAIFVVAIFLFVLSRYFVFAPQVAHKKVI